MRRLTIGCLAAGLVALTGCVGKAVNQATIYQPVSGVIEMDVKVPAGETVSKVQFQVNDKVVGEDDGSSGAPTFSAEVDTSTLPADTLAKLAAVGVRPDGSTVVLRENYILVEPSADATNTGDQPAPLASGQPDATPASVTPTATDAANAYRGTLPTTRTAARGKRKVTVIHL